MVCLMSSCSASVSHMPKQKLCGVTRSDRTYTALDGRYCFILLGIAMFVVVVVVVVYLLYVSHHGSLVIKDNAMMKVVVEQ